MTQYTNGRPVPMTPGRAYFIASPPWATTAAGSRRARTLRSRSASRGSNPAAVRLPAGCPRARSSSTSGGPSKRPRSRWRTCPGSSRRSTRARAACCAPLPRGEGMTCTTSGLPSFPRCAVTPSVLPVVLTDGDRTVAAKVASHVRRVRYDCSSWGNWDGPMARCPRRRAPGVCMRTLVVACDYPLWPTEMVIESRHVR